MNFYKEAYKQTEKCRITAAKVTSKAKTTKKLKIYTKKNNENFIIGARKCLNKQKNK